ncbi:nucleotidyltransferase domain-containing protein [Candidatus Spongiihabitans sp.]|uniref:nucleotidyltransferase domain-containing protein n=1 Tax=Candidatus Spongiihabitans sp. TaxID=3101308 RepID=UPI003C7AA5FB
MKLEDVREAVSKRLVEKPNHYSVFCCGSLARGDFGRTSDLDIFVFSKKDEDKWTRLSDIELLSELIFVNKELGFPEFSNDGMFLKVLSFPEMTKSIGCPKDDEKNLFTSRMLMLLESRPVFNDVLYDSQMDEIVGLYFRDDVDRRSFKPLFLLNDLLRFWRTLCLNYEIIRNDKTKPFRKKNINLKFSRMLTVFATILPIISKHQCSKEDVLSLCKQTPLTRLAVGLDNIRDDKLLAGFDAFLDHYEFFLNQKENMSDKPAMETKEKEEINATAIKFSGFLYKCLSHRKIQEEYRKYLVL